MMRFEKVGPLGLWNLYRDDWIVSRRGAQCFFVASILTLALTPVFLGKVDASKMSGWMRLSWGILGTVGPVALFFLWLGMWRYWARIDDSAKYVRRLWFLVLLFGFWYGSCLYYFLVYIPQYLGRKQSTAQEGQSTRSQVNSDVVFRPGLFGRMLIACWVLLFAVVALLFLFPTGAATPQPKVIWAYSVVLVPLSMLYIVFWLYRLGMRRTKS